MGKTEMVDTICDIVFDLSSKTTCMPVHGILISFQTSNEFNGKPVYSHTISHIIQITEIGYVPSLKVWDHFILSEVERHEVYKTLD